MYLPQRSHKRRSQQQVGKFRLTGAGDEVTKDNPTPVRVAGSRI